MALMTGAYGGFDYDRMIVTFTMLSGYIEVPCAISTGAMDDLDGASNIKADQREHQFMRLRERIECGASRKFDRSEFEGRPPGIILRSIDFR